MRSVTNEELWLYCKVDSEELKTLAVQNAESAEETLLGIGIALTEQNRLRFGLCVKAMALHELDHPGEPIPRGIREKINNLKFSRRRENNGIA